MESYFSYMFSVMQCGYLICIDIICFSRLVSVLCLQGAEEIDLTGKKAKEEVTEIRNLMQTQVYSCSSCDYIVIVM